MSPDYPIVLSGGAFPIVDDSSLEAHIRERCGDDVGDYIHDLLFGSCEGSELDEIMQKCAEVSSDLSDLDASICDVKDALQRIKNRLPGRGGIL